MAWNPKSETLRSLLEALASTGPPNGFVLMLYHSKDPSSFDGQEQALEYANLALKKDDQVAEQMMDVQTMGVGQPYALELTHRELPTCEPMARS